MGRVQIALFGLLVALAGSGCATNSKKGDVIVNERTAPSHGISYTPFYRTLYDIDALSVKQSCDNPAGDEGIKIPADSRFRQSLDRIAQTENSMIVHVYRIPKEKESLSATLFEDPVRVCLQGPKAIQKSRYRRIGGVSTGALIVPFKLRGGDLYADTAIGPYISYRTETTEFLVTAGLSQIALSTVGSSDVDTKTGLTVAGGINVSVAKNWDVAFLLGADHISGADGRAWEFQDKVWVSFAIGFSFTTR